MDRINQAYAHSYIKKSGIFRLSENSIPELVPLIVSEGHNQEILEKLTQIGFSKIILVGDIDDKLSLIIPSFPYRKLFFATLFIGSKDELILVPKYLDYSSYIFANINNILGVEKLRDLMELE